MRVDHSGAKKITLRCDNTTTCRAANVGVAYSAAMQFALRIRACQELNVRYWLVHVGTKSNRIADLVSRGKWDTARKAVRGHGWTPEHIGIAEQVADWESELTEWTRQHSVLDHDKQLDEHMESEIQEVEGIDLGLHITEPV